MPLEKLQKNDDDEDDDGGGDDDGNDDSGGNCVDDYNSHIALWRGLPVIVSKATVVSRWFVKPTAIDIIYTIKL